MSFLRVLAVSLVLLVGLVACRKEALPSGHPSQVASNVTSVNLGNIAELYDSTQPSSECRSDSDTVVCTARNGRTDRWVTWNIPSGPNEDGDGTAFQRIGRWKGIGRFEVIQVSMGHDSPGFLFWDREGGGWISIHPGTDSVFVGKDLATVLVLGWTPQEIQTWDYWKNLGGSARHFVCTPPTGKIAVDTLACWIGPSLELVPLDFAKLETYPMLGCKEAASLFDTAIAGYMERPKGAEVVRDTGASASPPLEPR